MFKGLLRWVVVAAMLLLVACGGGQRLLQPVDDASGTADGRLASPTLLSVGAKAASGAPAGIFVEWTREPSPSAVGYYLYRYTDHNRPPEPDPGDNPPFPIELRVNDGNPIPQPPSGATVRFDDYFEALVNETYYYRVTVVDNQVPPQESYPSNEMSWTIHGHNVTGMSPTEVYWGDAITIDGDTFGDLQGAGDNIRFPAYHGGTIDGIVTAWSDIQITATVPVGAVTGKVLVVIETIFAETDDDLVILNPVITSIDPAVAFSEDQLTITGEQFAAEQGTSTVAIGAIDVSDAVTSWSATEIWLDIPVVISRGDVVVTVDGHPSNPIEFTPRPQILSLDPAAIQSGEPLTLVGRHFLDAGGRVLFNLTEELTIGSWTAETISISGITSVTGLHLLTVESSEGHVSNDFTLTITDPLAVELGGIDGVTIYTLATAPTVTVTTAPDADRVELIIDGAVAAVSTTAPFEDLVIPVASMVNGEHTVSLKAYRRAIVAECADQPVFVYSLPADINGDGVVDELDTALLQTLLWMTNLDDGFFPWFDPDGDDEVTEADNSAVGYNWGNTVSS